MYGSTRHLLLKRHVHPQLKDMLYAMGLGNLGGEDGSWGADDLSQGPPAAWL